MLTLSHGFFKPQNGVDAGSVWFPAMEKNIQQLNDHTHNTTDSAQLFVQTQNILSANWTATSGVSGLYQQTITLPANYLYDVTDMFFRLSTGEIWFPTIVRLSTTQYNIFINDNTLAAVAFYR